VTKQPTVDSGIDNDENEDDEAYDGEEENGFSSTITKKKNEDKKYRKKGNRCTATLLEVIYFKPNKIGQT